MKHLKYIALSGLLFLLAILQFSCTEKSDWDVDSDYDRLFRVTKLSVSADKTDAELTWTSTPNTGYYIVEVSKDSLYDEVPMGTANGAIVYGIDKTVTTSPFTLTNLESSGKYYLRIKGMAETKESKWAYLDSYYFSTKGEQILASVSAEDKTDNSVTLRWDAGSASVTHIILSWTVGDRANTKQFDLNSENIANQELFIEGLLEATTYTAAIYNGGNKRGEISFRTNESIPQGSVAYTLNGTEDIVAYLKQITASDVILILPAGSLYVSSWVNDLGESQTTLSLPDNIVSLAFWGSEGDNQAVINTTSIKLSGGTTKLKFKNVELRGKSSSSDYVVNENVTRPITEVSFDGCTINNFRGVFRLQNDLNTSFVSSVSFTNCVVHTIEGYGLVNGSANATFGDIAISNCTFYDLKEVFVVLKSKPNSIVMSNCTFYNAIKDGKYYFDMKGDTDCTPDNFKIEKCIFGKNYSGTARATNPAIKTTTFVFDSYIANDCLLNTGYPLVGVVEYENSSSALFTDPDNADFSIKDSGFAGKGVVGDSRWW